MLDLSGSSISTNRKDMPMRSCVMITALGWMMI